MEEKELKEGFVKLTEDLKGYVAKAAEEKAIDGKARAETLETIQRMEKKQADMASQLDAIDLKVNIERLGGGGTEEKTTGEEFTESKEYKAVQDAGFSQMSFKDGRIKVSFEKLNVGRKAITLSGLGTGTTGVLMPQRLDGITDLPRQELRIRDLIRNVRKLTSGSSFDWVKQLARTNLASPQNEGVRKAESTYTWEAKIGTVKTIAHFTKATRQAIEDVPWLQAAINDELMYGLRLKEESEILMGDGLGQHLDGITHQATARSAAYDVSGDTNLDRIRHAKLQARLIGLGTFAPDGLVVNPKTMHDIELIKTADGGANTGMYILGDPRGGNQIPLIWGMPTVQSDSMPVGKFLVGAFGTAVELIDRMNAVVELAYQNEADFVENLVTILCEERLGMAVKRPDAFVYGDAV